MADCEILPDSFFAKPGLRLRQTRDVPYLFVVLGGGSMLDFFERSDRVGITKTISVVAKCDSLPGNSFSRSLTYDCAELGRIFNCYTAFLWRWGGGYAGPLE